MPAVSFDSRWVRVALAVALPLLAIACYAVGTGGGFVFDDFPNIVENVAVHVDDLRWSSWSAAAFSSEAGSLQRPLSMLSFAANTYFTGLDAAAMKWTNIGIHGLNALLVFGLACMVLRLSFATMSIERARRVAWCCAAIWVVHPINFMAVLYVVQRMESLSHVFVFGGLWLYLRGRMLSMEGRGGRWQIGVGLVGGTALAALCKESGVLLPLYAWLAEWCLPALRTSRDRREIRYLFVAVLWLPAVAGLAWLLPRVTSPAAWASRDFDLLERAMSEGRVLLDYLRWHFLPSLNQLSLFHDDYAVSRGLWSPPTTLPSMLGCIALLGFAVWLRNKRPLASLGLLWFFAAQSLTATIIPLDLVYEHRNYFASIGVILAVADLWLLVSPRLPTKALAWGIPACVVLALALTTHLRAREWSTPLRLSASEAAKRPQSPRATYGHARALIIASDYRADSPFLAPARKALAEARALPGAGILPHSAELLLAAHTDQPLPPDIWQDMRHRLRTRPIGPQELNALMSIAKCTVAGACKFAAEDVLSTYDAALSQGPIPDILTIKGQYLLRQQGNPQGALVLWREVVRLSPGTPQYRSNLIKLLIHMRRYDEARAEIAALRAMGKLGQNEREALALEARLAASRP
jgi:protein O-mannosyl-transferase